MAIGEDFGVIAHVVQPRRESKFQYRTLWKGKFARLALFYFFTAESFLRARSEFPDTSDLSGASSHLLIASRPFRVS